MGSRPDDRCSLSLSKQQNLEMKPVLLLIFLLTAISFSSCQKERVWVKYSETGCADQWWPNDDTESAVKEFFDDLDVAVLNVSVQAENEPDMCQACFCLTGNVIRCEVREKDLSVMMGYGFTTD